MFCPSQSSRFKHPEYRSTKALFTPHGIITYISRFTRRWPWIDSIRGKEFSSLFLKSWWQDLALASRKFLWMETCGNNLNQEAGRCSDRKSLWSVTDPELRRHHRKWNLSPCKVFHSYSCLDSCIVLYCFDRVVIAAQMHCGLFEICCAPPNLGITRTWKYRLNFAQRPIFSGMSVFNEPEISDLGPPA